jgi:hypothetical protein
MKKSILITIAILATLNAQDLKTTIKDTDKYSRPNVAKEYLLECAKLHKEMQVQRAKITPAALFNTINGMKEELSKHEPKILQIEKRYQDMVRHVATTTNSLLLDDIVTQLKTTDEQKIIQEASHVLFLSKSKRHLKEALEWIVSVENKDYHKISEIFASLKFIEPESFNVIFQVMQEIGFDNTKAHRNSTSWMLLYIATYRLSEHSKVFYNFKDFHEELHQDILVMLSYFLEAKEVIIQAYKEHHPYFDVNDPNYFVDHISNTFFLQQEEKLALKVVRAPENICIGGNDVIQNIIKMGDKKDGEYIANVVLHEIKTNPEYKEKEDASFFVYTKLDQAYDVSNPELLVNIIDAFYVGDQEIRGMLSYMLSLQFGNESTLPPKEVMKLNEALADEESPAQFFVDFWNKIEKTDMRRKFLRINVPYSLEYNCYLYLMERKEEKDSFVSPYGLGTELIVSTGEYFPFNGSGYYGTMKKHIDVWLEYLAKNKEKYEPGRWYRYGRYVDVPYKPIGTL